MNPLFQLQQRDATNYKASIKETYKLYRRINLYKLYGFMKHMNKPIARASLEVERQAIRNTYVQVYEQHMALYNFGGVTAIVMTIWRPLAA